MPPSLRFRRCLILGGGGFLGGHLVEALQADGYQVRVFDRVPRRATSAPIAADTEWFEGDFGNRGDLAAAVNGCQVVVHLVATTLPRTSNEDPGHDLESNLLPTVRFLEVALEHGVKRVVFASSGGTVYGRPEFVPVPETHPTQPLCSYGIHKLAIEHFLHLYQSLHGLEYCVLRLANPFGERQRSDASQGAVAVFLEKALRGEDVTVWGDGSAVRDYIYVGDVAQAFCKAIAHDAPAGLFNIGSGQGQSVNDLLLAIEALLDRPIARRYVEGRPFDVPVNVLDISRAARELGWQPRVTFREGLERTLSSRRRLADEQHGRFAGPPRAVPVAAQQAIDDARYEDVRSRQWFYDFDLPDGTSTHSCLPASVAPIHPTRLDMLWRALDPVIGDGWRESAAIDIACHQGFFASHLARRGCRRVLGVDARAEHVEAARLIASVYGLANLTVEQQDVRSMRAADLGTFDIVVLFGLLYHVENPVGLVRLARALTRRVCVIETQIAPPGPGALEWGNSLVHRPIVGTFAVVDETGGTERTESNVTAISLCPSLDALLWVMRSVGFDRVEVIPPGADAYEQLARGARVVAAGYVD